MLRAIAAWSDKLSGFSEQHIHDAMQTVTDKYPSWPPTLGEFVELVRMMVPARHARTVITDVPEPLPVSPEVDAAVRSILAQAKAAVQDSASDDDGIGF